MQAFLEQRPQRRPWRRPASAWRHRHNEGSESGDYLPFLIGEVFGKIEELPRDDMGRGSGYMQCGSKT